MIGSAEENDVPSWPAFRGANAAGVAVADETYPAEFGLESGLLWRTEVPVGHSSPVIWGDSIFVTAFDAAVQELQVLCIDGVTGDTRWRRTVASDGIEKVHPVSNPATATPIVDGNRVIAYFGSAGLFAFDFQGKLLWSAPMSVAELEFGSGNSPVLAGDWVILSREGADQSILAFDRKTGRTIWQESLQLGRRPRGMGYASPIVWRDQVVLHRTGEILGLDLVTGKRRWWLRLSTQGASTPVVGNGRVYVTSWNNFGDPDLIQRLPPFSKILETYDQDGDGVLIEQEFPNDVAVSARIDGAGVPGAVLKMEKGWFRFFDKDKDAKVDEVEWDNEAAQMGEVRHPNGLLAIRLDGTGELSQEAVVWRENRGVSEVPSPLLYRDKLYMVTNGGIVTCMDSQTGEVHFRARLGVPGLYYASPVASGGRVYFASGEGVATVISDASRLEVLARNDLREPIFATPALSQGRIYLRTTGHLYAFGQVRDSAR